MSTHLAALWAGRVVRWHEVLEGVGGVEMGGVSDGGVGEVGRGGRGQDGGGRKLQRGVGGRTPRRYHCRREEREKERETACGKKGRKIRPLMMAAGGSGSVTALMNNTQ